MLAAAYQARSLQRRLIVRRRRIQLAGADRLLHGPQISFGIILAENIIKTALRQTNVQRHLYAFKAVDRSEERRVGKACVSTRRSRWSTYLKKNQHHKNTNVTNNTNVQH